MYKNEAIEKLKNESKESGFSSKANAIKEAVLTALTDFCEQDDEFAQAIVQSNHSFKQCLEKIVEKCGKSISDIECYQKAVGFYFPGAKVNMTLTIDLIGDAAENKSNVINLSLLDLFGGDE